MPLSSSDLASSRDKQKSLISNTRLPMPTELGKIITYPDGLLPIKSQDSLIMWSC